MYTFEPQRNKVAFIDHASKKVIQYEVSRFLLAAGACKIFSDHNEIKKNVE
jgi:hypothetical protein